MSISNRNKYQSQEAKKASKKRKIQLEDQRHQEGSCLYKSQMVWIRAAWRLAKFGHHKLAAHRIEEPQ